MVAVTVNDTVPALVGVPESTPVLAFNDAHAGSPPEFADHMMGWAPTAVKVCV